MAENWPNALSVGASVAEIATGLVAGTIGFRLLWSARTRRLTLERHLSESTDQKPVSRLTELIALAGMTEAQIFEAALSSKKIRMRPSTEPNAGSGELLFHLHQKNRPKKERRDWTFSPPPTIARYTQETEAFK